jgi:phosphate-selective porin OprO/OprP
VIPVKVPLLTRVLGLAAGVLIIPFLASPARAQESIEARLERLEKANERLQQQNEQLNQQVQRLTSSPTSTTVQGEGGGLGEKDVRDLVKKAIKDNEAEKKKKDEAKEAEKKRKLADEGYKVGTEMGVTGKFNDQGYLWFATPNKDFTMHIGMWMNYDNVFFEQTPGLRTVPGARPGPPQGVASGIAAGGIGNLQDGTYFRRVRPFLEGTMWEVGEYRLIMALENDQFSTTGLDEFWGAVNKIPIIGSIRVGHVKTPMGLEADMTSSSRTMTFMERSSYSEAIELNQNFVTGIWFGNAFGHDKRVSYQAALFRQDQGASSGAFFGDGQFGAQARATCLPIWECEGRHWLHLGVSGGWRNGTNNVAVSPLRTFQLRARDELRDDDPAAGPAGSQVVPNSNDNRMIDTGPIAALNDYIMGLEMCYVRGPFSFQAEYGWNFLQGAYGVAPAGLVLNPPINPAHNYTFDGGYVQVAYTLTGEARAYDRNIGTLAREYFGPKGNFTNFWFLRDEHGHLDWGLGAWEVALRYSYTNLNSGTGPSQIRGGDMNGWTAGLNWYLNNNLKCMFDYVNNRRYAVPVGTIPGSIEGFGMRLQVTF